MKKILSFALVLLAVCVVGCGGEKTQSAEPPIRTEKTAPVAPSIKTITRAEADAKLKELSAGLNVRVDDMKEVTFCHCPINYDIHPPIYIIPFVVVEKDYTVSLRQDILYVGHEVLHFDKLYIKTSAGVETFRYENTVKSFDGGYVGEEYVGLMTDGLYQKLQTAISEGNAKFRFEGRSFAEREITKKELSDMAKIFAIYEFFKSVEVKN